MFGVIRIYLIESMFCFQLYFCSFQVLSMQYYTEALWGYVLLGLFQTSTASTNLLTLLKNEKNLLSVLH